MSRLLIGWANNSGVLVHNCGYKISGARTVKTENIVGS